MLVEGKANIVIKNKILKDILTKTFKMYKINILLLQIRKTKVMHNKFLGKENLVMHLIADNMYRGRI